MQHRQPSQPGPVGRQPDKDRQDQRVGCEPLQRRQDGPRTGFRQVDGKQANHGQVHHRDQRRRRQNRHLKRRCAVKRLGHGQRDEGVEPAHPLQKRGHDRPVAMDEPPHQHAIARCREEGGVKHAGHRRQHLDRQVRGGNAHVEKRRHQQEIDQPVIEVPELRRRDPPPAQPVSQADQHEDRRDAQNDIHGPTTPPRRSTAS